MTRVPDWKTRLIAYLTDSARRPFAYGTHDCALFAAGAVLAMTGVDPAAGFRGRYRTLQGGLKAVRAAGLADHVAMAQHLFQQVHVSAANPGDLAVIDTEEGAALGVMMGGGIYVLGPMRMGILPVDAARLFLAVP